MANMPIIFLLMYCGQTLKNRIYMRLSLVIKKRERRFGKTSEQIK
jgi:hypothetical protein